MTLQDGKAWKCSVCGYVHRGPEPPATCPVCGAGKDAFEPFEDPKPAPPQAPAERWRCLNCQYVHAGREPPDTCPVCGAPADRFEARVSAAAAARGRPAGRVIVVGAGVAGLSAAESLRSASPEAEIILLGKEPVLPYYRLNLTRFLAGEVDEQALPIHPESWYDAQRIHLRPGTEVSEILPDDGKVELVGGETLGFDKLVLTAGAHPFMPPISGVHREGVTALRTVDDAKEILKAVSSAGRCVCIGGGVLGLEAAAGLALRKARVTVLEGFGWLLPRQLNQRAAEILKEHVSSLGIEVLTGVAVEEIPGDERARAVRLKDGRELEADLVLVTTGVRANSYLARKAGLAVNQGVTVNDRLETSHPSILAAGDVAEHRGVPYGLWGAAQYQGTIAGMNAAGLEAEFGGIPRSNTLKVVGADLFSIGTFAPEDASYDIVEEERDGRYVRFVLRDAHLVGAILLGDTSLTQAVKRSIEEQRDFSALPGPTVRAADVMDFLKKRG